MATKSYIAGVPFDARGAGWVLPDTSALAEILQTLLAKIDTAGETVIGMQGLNDNNGMTTGIVIITKTH
jgi:hypothetical protein